MEYQREIDGLRAVAVVAVLLFHAGAPGFSGGFVGVDIFFVISGYLITGIIMRDLRQSSFSITSFYERRARRILPALYCMIFATIPVSYYMMMPSQLQDFSQSLIAVSVFCANIFFYLKSGYFEPNSELSPLLHTWSLAVEEQYYFIFPVFLVIVHYWLRKALIPLIVLLGVASFALAQAQLNYDPAASFFLPLGRAWELMIGALLSFLPRFKQRSGFQWELGAGLGALLMIISINQLTAEMPFPGLLAIPATLGAAMAIYCASPNNLTGKVLGSPLFVGLGLISYSTYLWHHPLFAAVRVYYISEPPLGLFIALVIVSIGLGYLSWRYIEKPFRNRELVSRKQLAVYCALPIVSVCVLGLIGDRTDGFAKMKYNQAGPLFRDFDERLAQLTRERHKAWKEILAESAEQFSGNNSQERVLVVGDSRGEDLYVSLKLNESSFPQTEFRYQRLDDLCFSTLKNSQSLSGGKCRKEAEEFLKRIQVESPDIILISCGWQLGSAENLETLLDWCGGADVVVFGNASFNEINSLFFAISSRNIPREDWPDFFAQNIHIRSKDASLQVEKFTIQRGIPFVDVYRMFEIDPSSNAGRMAFNLMTEEGDPLIIDQTHLTVEGAKRFGSFIAKVNPLRMSRRPNH